MSGSLKGPLAKLSRGHRQLELLKQKIEAVWPPGHTWPVRTEEHRGGLEYRFYLGELPSVDPDWALWAGEVMFDLRSSLDHLAWELHVRHFRGRVPNGIVRQIQFPIIDPKRVNWESNSGVQRIRHLSARDKRAIRNLQPDITRHDGFHDTRVRLNALNELHNVDKHRQLHVVGSAHNRARVPKFPAHLGLQTEPSWGPVESHSHVETWTFTEPPPTPPEHGGATIDITLDPEGEYAYLIELLEALVDGVGHVLARFADRFPPTNLADWPPLWRLRWQAALASGRQRKTIRFYSE